MKKDRLRLAPDMPIRIVRDQWNDAIWTTKRGVICPVCDRSGKMNPTRLTAPMVRMLAWIFKAGGLDWHDVQADRERPEFMKNNNTYPKLRWWGLLERKVDDDGHATGIYRVTNRGYQFLCNFTTVPKYVYLYNNTVWQRAGTDNTEINVYRALEGSEWTWEELVKPALDIWGNHTEIKLQGELL